MADRKVQKSMSTTGYGLPECERIRAGQLLQPIDSVSIVVLECGDRMMNVTVNGEVVMTIINPTYAEVTTFGKLKGALYQDLLDRLDPRQFMKARRSSVRPPFTRPETSPVCSSALLADIDKEIAKRYEVYPLDSSSVTVESSTKDPDRRAVEDDMDSSFRKRMKDCPFRSHSPVRSDRVTKEHRVRRIGRRNRRRCNKDCKCEHCIQQRQERIYRIAFADDECDDYDYDGMYDYFYDMHTF